MKPADLSRIHQPSDPRLSPDGTRLAFVVSTPNLEEDRYDRSIWIDDAPFTAGPGDLAPRWSPDGHRLAFLRSDGAKPAQAHVIPVGGGEAKRLTEFELGVEAIEWAPDGSSLAAIAITYLEEWADLDEDERNRRPRRITQVPFRFDNKGPWTHDRKRHIWLLDPDGDSEPRCLTPGDHNQEFPAWSPDGSKIAFLTDTADQPGLTTGNEVWSVDVESGSMSQELDRGFFSQVGYSPGGALHVLGNADPRYPVDFFLHRVENGQLLNLTGHLDRGSVSLAAGPAAIRWDGDDAIVGLEDSGTFGVIRVKPDGKVKTELDGQLVATGFDAHDGRVVYTASTHDSPGEVYDGDTQLTKLNQADLALVAPEHFRVDSDGVEVDVWVYLPDGDEKVPLLLNIHGGPASQYGFGFFDEFQVYAGAGYGVVACNPRGSAGRGDDFLRAVVGSGWGQVDYADITAAVAGALDRYDRLDPDRMGVMGGSYGGFMTGWIIGKENRWKSAVVERALTVWTSFSGTSDIGGVFPENYTLASYPDAWDRWWELGPLAMAHQVTTPTLVLHSETDWRCPIEQAEQYFMALLRNGTTTEFLRFPGEGHEMSRTGKPKHRVERFEAILDWHHRHLE
jgi:dipeptidyl aminopeptidase/acylaminoacyl peptidase